MGRELGRISGPLLADNLKRNGQNLAFDTSLLYFDVNNNYVGINSLGGSSALTIGTVKNDNSVGTSTLNTVNLIGTTTNIGNFTISANTIQHLTGGITISPNQSSNPTIVTPGLSTSNLYLSGNTYTTTVTNDSLNFTANGTGVINFANSGTVQVTLTYMPQEILLGMVILLLVQMLTNELLFQLKLIAILFLYLVVVH